MRARGPGGSRIRDWSFKRDAAGRPRRFLSHREAMLWGGLTVGKFVGAYALLGLLGAVWRPVSRGAVWSALSTALVLTAVLLATWLGVSLVLYLYVALSGGVMDEAARRRYRDDESPKFP